MIQLIYLDIPVICTHSLNYHFDWKLNINMLYNMLF